MSKPNFWRLKRKAKDREAPSVQNPPKISQKTISSFFGSKHILSNLNDDKPDTHNDHPGVCPKKQKIDESVSETSAEKVRLYERVRDKLHSFSAGTSAPLSSNAGSSLVGNEGKNSGDFEGAFNLQDCTQSSGEESLTNTGLLSSFKANSQISSGKALVSNGGKYAVKYTPLEQQVMALWKAHPGVLLFVECGYKYRFFGEDAEIAGKELNIYAHLDHNFMTASIPVHRLHAHVSRLVEKGYKVGVVKQVETAALKAVGDNKNAPFTRRLENIYTRATLIGEDLESQSIDLDEELKASHIFCFSEVPVENKKFLIAFVAVNPCTGNCVYDSFEDQTTREELQKRLQVINPAEIVTSAEISADSERLLRHTDSRLERLPCELFETQSALTRVTTHFVSRVKDSELASAQLERLTELPSLVVTCLAALVHHLTEFGLEKAICLNRLQQFSSSSDHLNLDASTVRNLELFVSVTGSVHGSLFWALNHTKTKFGARLLREWLAHPVRNLVRLQERQNRITELLCANESFISQLSALLTTLPDLERGLTCILHRKCSTTHFLGVVESLCKLRSELSGLLTGPEQDTGASAPLLHQLVSESIQLLSDVQPFRDNMNVQAAKEGDKTKLLKDFSNFPSVVELMEQITQTEKALDELRPQIARKLSLLSVDYNCVSGQEYLVEVRNTNSKSVPGNWRKISSTKQVGRYRPPYVDALFTELQRLRDMLRAASHVAWLELLEEFSKSYFSHKQAIHNIATLDVLLSLAFIARQEGYCKPNLFESENAEITIKRGRHPVVPLLFPSASQFVPNDTHLESEGECCMVLSGPNMGGKSCYIRQVALITLLAHIGSYVPAESARISVMESIHTRMGARDELFQGRSTLMVELDETSAILKRVTRRSLVLLDELGRGTGSCDGSAIACATLRHVVTEVQCLTLFVTHYPSVVDTARELGGHAGNYHMAFLLHDQEDSEVLTFLYEVVRGAADRSYGINVARLANLNKDLLKKAATVAENLENQAKTRREVRVGFVNFWKAGLASHL